MNRRAFVALTSFGFGLPRVVASAHADQPDADQGTAGTPVPAPSPTRRAQEIVTRVAAVYEKVTTFKAGFRQSSRYDGLKHPSGSVSFEKPASMSWRYASGDRVVSDGTRVAIYESANKQLLVRELAASVFPVALSFLSGQSLLERFEFTQPDSISAGEGSLVLIGEPRQPSPSYTHVVYYIDAKTYRVHRVQIGGARGYRVRFDFVRSTLNPRVPPGEFVFSAPSDTRL